MLIEKAKFCDNIEKFFSGFASKFQRYERLRLARRKRLDYRQRGMSRKRGELNQWKEFLDSIYRQLV